MEVCHVRCKEHQKCALIFLHGQEGRPFNCSTRKTVPRKPECMGGSQVIIRSFGTYQAQLWDDIFAEFAPITEKDVILVNFGAWYPRFKISEPHLPWLQWQNAMNELFVDKLATTPAQVQQILTTFGLPLSSPQCFITPL